jgi:hypothetical protein
MAAETESYFLGAELHPSLAIEGRVIRTPVSSEVNGSDPKVL